MNQKDLRHITTHLVLTGNLGVSGNLYGGQVMAWMDEAAAIYAMWATGGMKVVTRRFSEILFDHPVHAGERLEFDCGNPRCGTTSITFTVIAHVAEKVMFQAECTFVAVDDHGQKTSVDWSKSPLNQQK